MKKGIFILLGLLFPVLTLATPPGCDFCKDKDELYNKATLCNIVPEAQKFNFANYEKCAALLRQCPKHPPLSQASEVCLTGPCEKQILGENKECRQLQSITDKLAVSPNSLTIKRVGNLAIVRQISNIDGQEHYYIFTPNGCLIDTALDPRKASENLSKQYQSTDFYVLNWDKPSYRVNNDGTQTISVLLKVTDSCKSCAIIGWAVLNFNFSNGSILTDVQLVSFKEHWED